MEEIITDKSEKGKKVDSKSAVFFRVLNSSLLFAIAFIFNNFLFHFVTAFYGWIYERRPRLFFTYIINDEVPRTWYKKAVVLVYTAGPFYLFLLSLIFFIVYNSMGGKLGQLKVLVFWLMLIAFAFFTGHLFAAPIFQRDGLGIAFAWLYINVAVQFIGMFAAIVIMFAVGMVMWKYLLQLSPSSRFVRDIQLRKKFVLEMGILPTIFGSIIVILFSFPHLPPVKYFVLISTLIILISTYIFTGQVYKPVKVYRQDLLTSIYKPAIIVLVLFVLIFRVLMMNGIPFY